MLELVQARTRKGKKRRRRGRRGRRSGALQTGITRNILRRLMLTEEASLKKISRHLKPLWKMQTKRDTVWDNERNTSA